MVYQFHNICSRSQCLCSARLSALLKLTEILQAPPPPMSMPPMLMLEDVAAGAALVPEAMLIVMLVIPVMVIDIVLNAQVFREKNPFVRCKCLWGGR
jgi:hypothetical protein